ncbi:MAG: hypothetical protein K0S70_121 [Microbacterium sp.]|nr:hypothetical protein [Microbacterium sp.]
MLPEFLALANTPSDWLLLYCLLPSAAFFITYTTTSPWWKVREFGWLGVVTVLHSLSVGLLLFLICYGIVFGQKIDEEYRVAISGALAFALTSKYVVFLLERRAGLRERRETKRLKVERAERHDSVMADSDAD